VNPEDLDERIAQARARSEAGDRAKEAASSNAERSGMGLALSAASRFVSAIVVGGVIGWGLDHWLGTKPFGLLILLLAGFVIGLAGLRKFMT